MDAELCRFIKSIAKMCQAWSDHDESKLTNKLAVLGRKSPKIETEGGQVTQDTAV